MKKYLTEFIGTFFLVLTVGLVVRSGTDFAPIAIGSVLMVMIYMGGHISGAHYNPAVTLACLIRGACSAAEAPIYMVSQVAGGVAAGVMTGVITGEGIAVNPGDGVGMIPAYSVEILFTFALALVVLNTATSKDHPDNSFYGLAIGFTVLAAAFAGGGISGGAFNPAVALGHNIPSTDFSNILLYIVGPLLGGALAGVVFKIQNPHEY